MNFVKLQDWFLNEKICPLRSKIQSIIAVCNQLLDSIPESRLKEEVLKSDSQQVIFTFDYADSNLTILVGDTKFSMNTDSSFRDFSNSFFNAYHVNLELIALSFNNMYKIVFSTDLFDTYVPALSSKLETAYPNAKIELDEINKTLSITNTIDL